MQLYKPNKSGKGHGLGLKFNSKDKNLFLSIIKQTGFSDKGKGTFNGGKECIAALGPHEVGGILAVIHGLKLPVYKTDKVKLEPTRHTQEYHHESEKQSLKLTFAPYITKEGDVRGLSISVSQTEKASGENTLYSFWATIDELFLIENYLNFVLNHFHTAEYSADKKAREEYFKNKPSDKKDSKQEVEQPAESEKVDADEGW